MEWSVLKYRVFSKHKIHLGGTWCYSQTARQPSSRAAKSDALGSGTRTPSWVRQQVYLWIQKNKERFKYESQVKIHKDRHSKLQM